MKLSVYLKSVGVELPEPYLSPRNCNEYDAGIGQGQYEYWYKIGQLEVPDVPNASELKEVARQALIKEGG